MICIAENQKMGVLAPNSIAWSNIWVEKLLFVGFAERHLSTWEQGRGKALRLLRGQHCACCCSYWWSPESWALKSLLFTLRSGYCREGRGCIAKRMLSTLRLSLFPKPSLSSFGECKGQRRTPLSSTLHMSQWLSVIPLPCCSAKASCES